MTIRFIAATPPTKAEGQVAEIYAAMKEDFMFAEPVSLHAPSPALLSAFWAVFRDVMVGKGETERWDREVVAGAVSAANDCHFCVVTHAAMEKASPDPSGPRDRAALADWAKNAMTGGASDAPGFSAQQSQELQGVVVLFQYLNRMVSTFMEKASSFDPPADGRALSDGEQKMRDQIMAMVSTQMAKTVVPSGSTDPAAIAERIGAALPADAPAPLGAASAFAKMVAAEPSAVTADLVEKARAEAGGDVGLIHVAAASALHAAQSSFN